MGWIEPHGSGFRGRVQVGGERLSTETASTKKRAKELLRDLERQLTDPHWQDPRRGDVLFSVWVEEWKATRGGLARSTTSSDAGRLKNHLLPAFGEAMLSEIDPLRVRQWVSTLSGSRSAKTVRHCHALLFGILELAVESERLRRNPCRGSRLPRVGRKDQVLLTPQDLTVFIDCFEDATARSFVETKAGTGTRWGELTGLRVSRVDLTRRRLHIREVLSEVDGVLRFKETPKTDAGYRTISFTHAVADALRPLVVGREPDELVFVSRDCAGSCRYCLAAREEIAREGMAGRLANDRRRMVHAYRNRNFRRDHWDPALKAAAERGMTLRPTPHDMRHTHASILINAGVPPTVIQRRLGHASIKVTSDTYGYLMPSSDAKVLSVLEQALPPARGRTLDDELADMLGGTTPPRDGGGT